MEKKTSTTILFLGFMLLFLAGCAGSRGVLDVRVTLPENSKAVKAIKIVRVTDDRVFELRPKIASIPSLKGGEINNKALTLRAIARKRNMYGMALGDILLPEGRTVEDLVKEALIRAFRESEYRVIDKSDMAYSNAIPIEVDINQFWSWFTPGMWSVKLEFESRIKITGDVPGFANGNEVRGYVLLHSGGAGTRQWMNTLNKGITNLIAGSEYQKTLKRIKAKLMSKQVFW